MHIKNFKKIDEKTKKNIKAGAGFNFWNFSLCFSLIVSGFLKFLELIINAANFNKNKNNTNTTQKLVSGNYGSNTAYFRLSKYPSKTTVTSLV